MNKTINFGSRWIGIQKIIHITKYYSKIVKILEKRLVCPRFDMVNFDSQPGRPIYTYIFCTSSSHKCLNSAINRQQVTLVLIFLLKIFMLLIPSYKTQLLGFHMARYVFFKALTHTSACRHTNLYYLLSIC